MRMTLVAGALLVLALPACTVSSSPSTAPGPGQPTAGAVGSQTRTMGALPTISPNDPAYAENGAPRAGQPAGVDTAGAPMATGNYAPIQHQGDHHGGSPTPQ
jgi:hypothetical protein